MIRILLGGSPCTKWSISQTKKREILPRGEGWELFRNYLIAKEKFKPDFFLYENNKSASEQIKNQIRRELGEGTDPSVRFTYINSALLSAQKRERFYVTNFGDIQQPEDKGILLQDILENGYNLSNKDKSYCLTASYAGAIVENTLRKNQRTMVCEPVRVGGFPKKNGEVSNSQGMRVYSIEGKSIALTANGGGWGAKTGLYAIPVTIEGFVPTVARSQTDGKLYTVYSVKDGLMKIKSNEYPVKHLSNGFYIVRKLTVTECERLQTLPDGYCKAVSDSQAYKGLGNGWTADVIIHLLQHALKNIPKNEKLQVLSMYDGISTGRYCLEKMGFTNIEYHAYEIDKYAKTISYDNYPTIKQHGNAFDVRKSNWKINPK